MEKGIDTQLPSSLPYTFQIKAEWNGDVDNDDLVFMLLPDYEILEFEVSQKELRTTTCGTLPVKIPSTVSGVWTFEMSNQQMEVSLNGYTIITVSHNNECLMKYIRAATAVVFSDKDDISQQIRLAAWYRYTINLNHDTIVN